MHIFLHLGWDIPSSFAPLFRSYISMTILVIRIYPDENVLLILSKVYRTNRRDPASSLYPDMTSIQLDSGSWLSAAPRFCLFCKEYTREGMRIEQLMKYNNHRMRRIWDSQRAFLVVPGTLTMIPAMFIFEFQTSCLDPGCPTLDLRARTR